ncbi:hypothetical protein N0V93_005108 [Gnomoniopsis smithogilvyi]|uniref:Uncharacterized protein n=1 Tax=Gnomoniopsis smithogilvyi TaxID=1191159 RepID=A0A9W9CXU0_9PEZI|nr:hypothetical protein N0V93_005108 [Gnomoniopsis smithogilvyi]
MNARPPTNAPPVPQETGEDSGTHGIVFRAADHLFWDQQSVPKPDSDEFRTWSEGNSAGSEQSPVPKFVPKDQHYGIWKAPPNKDCHSSFGDQGTTVSTNCFGDIIQLTQYLGAGRSGLFSIDRISTYGPFFVYGRARDLEDLVKGSTASLSSYDLVLPTEFAPKEPLNVKWVNWRWPRYEYDTDVTNVKASAQWVVNNGVVLKQVILENAGHEDIEIKFTCHTNRMLIRDLDYLDRAYHFNNSAKGYSYVPGPHGFGFVCIHTLEPPARDDGSGDHRALVDKLRPGTAHRNASGEIGEELYRDSRSNPATRHEHSPLGPDLVPSAYAKTAQPDMDVQPFDSLYHARPHSSTFNERERAGAEDNMEHNPLMSNSHAVAAVITTFVNGKPIKTHSEGSDDANTFTIAGRDSASKNSNDSGKLVEVVVAYKMILIPGTSIDWRNFIVSAEEADVNAILQRETDSLWESTATFSLPSIGIGLVDIESDVQNKAAKVSNTESSENLYRVRTKHGPENIEPDAGSAASDERTNATKVGGEPHRAQHRIETPFKTSATTHPAGTQGKTSPRDHLEYLAWRHLEHILSVCAIPLSPPGLIEATGDSHSSHTVTRRSAADAPVAFTCGDMAGHRICTSASFFAFTFLIDVCNDEEEKKEVDDLLLETWTPWLLELDKIDRRSSHAWPHSFYEDVNLFRLSDHVWIWRALRSLEDLDLWKSLPSLKSVRAGQITPKDPKYRWIFQSCGPEVNRLGEEEAAEKFDELVKRFLPADVQRNTLQHFTTERDLDVSRKRMLAVTRSPKETRFLLHSRDTCLFYAENLGFFLPGSPYQELWENTLQAQLHHDENKDPTWDKGLRYALGIVAGTRGYPLNNKDPTELVRTCVEVLIRSSSHAGFLSGLLDKATKEPCLSYEEEDANFYHHAGFEIHHVLLTYAMRIAQSLHKGAEPFPRPLRPAATTPSMDKDGTMPFNNLVDVSSIDAFEDEWLYNYPQFFTMQEIDFIEHVDKHLLFSHISRDAIGGIIGQELEMHRNARAHNKFRFPSSSAEIATFIAEMPEKQRWGKREKRGLSSNIFETASNFDLWSKLKAPRTAANAQKRLIWLPLASAETAFLCWVASPETEKPAVSLFFDRHSKYEKHIWDDTTMATNTWQTELHLSFYKLVDAALIPTLGLPSTSKDPFPGSSKRDLRRASMGFRFDGDFFDRYWTCHYIEHIDLPNPLQRSDFPFESPGRNEEKQWWQRKFLELQLLRRILTCANESSLEILETIRNEMGIEDSTLSFSILDSDAYLSTQENWQRFENILRAVEEDLSAVLRTLDKWERREAERGQHKPRWTRTEERNHRWAISKLQGATERETRELESHRDKTRTLKEAFTTSREKVRDDRELRRNENIRYFTYVTVIFLPLGFAASFYSMNGAPQHALMLSLVEFAIAAFGVTVGLLASAKVIFEAIDTALLPLKSLRKQAELRLEKFSRSKKEGSLLYGDRDGLQHPEIGTEEQEQAANSRMVHAGPPQPPNNDESTEGQKQLSSPRRNHVRQSIASARSSSRATSQPNVDEVLHRRLARITHAPDLIRPFKNLEKRLEKRSKTNSWPRPAGVSDEIGIRTAKREDIDASNVHED